MSDSFEDAVDGVNSKKGGDETAEVFYEKRKYPLLPEGVYPAMCVRAIIDDANPNGKFYQQGDKVIKLTWEIRQPDLYMKDEEGKVMKDSNDKPMPYRVFNRPISIGFGERTNLRKLFLKLTGFDLSLKENGLVQKTIKKIDMGNGRFKEGFSLKFDQKMFEYMEANLVIQHQQWEDNMGETRTSAYIETYMVSQDQKKKNYDQLPPEAKNQKMSTEDVDLASEQSTKEQQVEYSKDAESTMGKLEQAHKEKIENDPGLKEFMDDTDAPSKKKKK